MSGGERPAAASSKKAPTERFLNRDFTDAGLCSMWMQVKLLFGRATSLRLFDRDL